MSRKKTILEWALEYHSAGINIVKVIYKDKFPEKGGKWKKYRNDPASVEQLTEWFSSETSYGNISAITGAASGGLTVLDCDSVQAYNWWAEKHPDLDLPTVKSGRGYHIYFRSNLTADKSFDKIELKANGLVSVPPSMHKSKVRYKWITPLPAKVAELPLLDPLAWNLEDFTDGIDGSDGSEGKDGSEGGGGGDVCTLKSLSLTTQTEIAQVIDRTLPQNYGQRYKLLFLLARKLKKIDEIKKKSAEEIMFIADIWHEAALPNIETKSLTMTRARFKNAWEDAKYPPGEGMSLEIAREAAFSSTEPMPELEPYTDEEVYQKVIRLGFELQRLAGVDDVWFIPTNKAKELFGVSHSWLAMILNDLQKRKIIKLTRKHTKTKCARYKYIGQSAALL
jgi:hypothetical protein